ncbi:bifunctional folylpolyglutamate synthase/dihydrofolate synthase [Clostridium sp. MCC353]|uniref:bifunctional folylpolyglutamate synthase/dihydrofolate synthase n=1 Tax=Clostridium sp. MCC353 TaxID=2592646 RepID=UPI001C00D1C7|nr:folylpolyglutamate synthase/dihydrofolate synthase family protein [Clostridium sp. MCC353]MBT9779993.1 bifunctional folylpolyglutamate synthase/dihydrofolate synthase [Clostridium sp. MCC353]
MDEIKAEEYLLNIPLWTKKKNSLEDVRKFAEKLGNPDRDMRIIHVAGTNGKGSVCAYLTSILRQAGYHTGTFISPHLIDIRERFLVDGNMADKAVFSQAFEKVYEVTQQMMEEGYCYPTFFEFLFLMGLCIFREENVDYLILETGLGGRLDTTNIIERPLACIITSISLEHTEYLGDTIELIAGEKAGIIKEHVPVIFDGSVPEAAGVIEKKAAMTHSTCYPVNAEEFRLNAVYPAPYQRMNAALACKALDVIMTPPLDESVLLAGINNMKWPGRMEQVMPDVYLDGAHNPGGIAAFIEAAAPLAGERGKGCSLLFGVVSDKDYCSMVKELCRSLPLKRVYLAHMDSSRAMDTTPLAQLFNSQGISTVTDCGHVKDGFLQAVSQKEDGELLFCVGSLYLIGEIEAVLALDDRTGTRNNQRN